MKILAPLAGWSSGLGEVPDEVFARGLMGDGVAIDPTVGELRAPCDGEVISIAAARHAVALRATCGAELLMHVGIDTVALGGAGFTLHTRQGDRVRAGDLLLSFDLDALAGAARSLITPVIVTNSEQFRLSRPQLDRALTPTDVLFEVEPLAPRTERAATAETRHVAVSESLRVAHAHGIHARPAALIARLAKSLPHELEVRAHGRVANPRSALALMSLGVRGGDELTVVGFDAAAAAGIAEIAALIRNLEAAAPEASVSSPADLAGVMPAQSSPTHPRGVIASRGFAVGRAYLLEKSVIDVAEAGTGDDGEALERARAAVRTQLERRARSATAAARAIMAAHLELLDDPQLVESARATIAAGKSAGFAWRASLAASSAALAATGDARLAERAADLEDLEQQVLRELTGGIVERDAIPDGSILIARDLTPSELIDIDTARLGGIALMEGGPTSHVAILAATLGVPMLVSLGGSLRAVAAGAELILDAEAGELWTAPDAARLDAARTRLVQLRTRQAQERASASQPCRLASGERIDVFANLAGAPADTRLAIEQGAEGCGLLRTEFLFLERTTAPDESEQRASYQQVAQLLGDRPLVIRTLDIGGDKPIAYLPLPAEDNPALGLRGIRTSLWRPELLEVQLRALLGAGPTVRVLVPMITEYAEIAFVRERLRALAGELGVPVPQLGAMIETPAAAMLADQVARAVDFLSIGTNDLAQYGLAMDRGHAALAARIDGVHPAVLRLIEATTRGAARHSRPVAVCGGLASDPDAVPLLLGLGVTELSVVPGQIARLKAFIRTLSLDDCCRLAERALQLDNAADVRKLVKESQS